MSKWNDNIAQEAPGTDLEGSGRHWSSEHGQGLGQEGAGQALHPGADLQAYAEDFLKPALKPEKSHSNTLLEWPRRAEG